MIPPIHREPEPDARIAAALRERTGAAAPADAEREEFLAARIVQLAGPRLARLRRSPQRWWEWTAAWSRVAVPLGVAASLAGALLAVRSASDIDELARPQEVAVVDSVTESGLILEAEDAEGGTALAGRLVPQPTDEWLLAAVLDR